MLSFCFLLTYLMTRRIFQMTWKDSSSAIQKICMILKNLNSYLVYMSVNFYWAI